MQLNDNHVAACPFCGSIKAPIPDVSAVTQAHSVHCDRNEGGCGARSGYFNYEDLAVQAWHRRPEEERSYLPVLEKITEAIQGMQGIGCNETHFIMCTDSSWYFSYYDKEGLPCTGFSGDDLPSLADRLGAS